MSEQTLNDETPEDNQAQDDQARAGLDFIAAVADERIKRYFTDNWPAMIREVAGAVAEKINFEAIAVQAEKIFEDRWNEQARQNQAARAAAKDGNGDGGDDGAAGGVTANGGGGGGGDGGGGLGFLGDIQSGDGSNSEPQLAPVAQAEDPKQAVAIAGLRLLEDPMGAIERAIEMWGKVQDRRKPPPVPRNEYEVVAEIAARNPNLVNYFASEDPIAPAEKLGEMLSAGVKSGMRISEGIVKQATGLTKRAPKFVVPKVELVDPPPPSPQPTPATPEPVAPVVAPMAQDPAPKRRRRKLSDVV